MLLPKMKNNDQDFHKSLIHTYQQSSKIDFALACNAYEIVNPLTAAKGNASVFYIKMSEKK